MSLFVTSIPPTSGVFASEVPPPSVVVPAGSGTAVILGQFKWGPRNVLTFPSSLGAFYQTFAPVGSNRINSAHLSVIRKAWPVLGAIRTMDPTAATAAANIQTSGAVTVLVLTAAYPGSTGSSIIATVGAAGDVNANHFKLTVTLSGTSGSTIEVYDNLNVSGVGATTLPNVTNSVLLSAATTPNPGVPAPGNTTLSGGTDGTINSTYYVGTAGANDYGMALCENPSQQINHLFTDDCGSGLRAAVNSGMTAHVELTTDKIGYINGVSGQSASSAQSDVANYRSLRICYVDPWAYVYDDTTGATQLVPSSCWVASVRAQNPPSLSAAWRSLSPLFAGIASLEFNRGSARGQNTASGITTIIPNPGGGYVLEQDVNSSTIAGQVDLSRTAMGQFIGLSLLQSWGPFVNAPNVPFFQQDLVNSMDIFLGQLQTNAGINPAALPYIVAYTIKATSAVNTPASIGAGQFTIASSITTGQSMKQIIAQLQYGPTVTINVS